MPEFLIGRILVAYLLYLKLRFVCVDGVGWWGGGVIVDLRRDRE
jgi:hypothetical protein